ncbi:flagellin [Geodermatophilus saharensis]|uniref:Flagellin n=1 Tax=Geodermatophilus saharensis TaxID=1137994 RepID=A0A239INS3_9ACTN|nr:flagellin [Geodermatophilus saharensis]SNS95426.1 flagellin [Geodermatophilus saharensis]
MRIATNVAALHASAALERTDRSVAASLRRLSSGLRITRAADDATGLAVSEGLRARTRGTTVAVRNAQDGIGVVRTADGALDAVQAILRRMRDLAVQAGNAGALDAAAAGAVRTEFDQLRSELDDVAGTTSHGIRLLDGTYDRLLQVGADAGDTLRVVIAVSGRAVGAAGLGLSRVDVTGGLGLPHTLTPAVAVEPSTPAPGRLTLAVDPTSAAALAALTGTVEYDGRVLDLASVDRTGAVTAQDHLDRLAAAVTAALGAGPFAPTAAGLVLTGATPGPASLPADAAALTPRYTGPVPATVDAAVPAARDTAAPGRLVLAGDHVSADAYAESFDALAGTVRYGGRAFDLGSVDYSGAGTAQERLDRLNASAVAALGTGSTPFVATATGLLFTGETPGPASTAADAAAVTPTYTGDAGTAGTLRAIDGAIARVSDLRARLGAIDNRLSSRIGVLGAAVEGTTAAESRIRDLDVAAEVTVLTRGQVLAEAGIAVLAQANQTPARVLALLR